jgi:Htaa
MRAGLLALAVSLCVPAGALAADGATTIDPGGRAFQSLRAQGARIVARPPARIAGGAVRLPVRQGLVRSVALLNHGGSLAIRRRGRSLTLRRLQVRLGMWSRVTATVAGRRLKVLAVDGTMSVDPSAGSAALRRGRVTLTRAAARTFRRRLGLKRLPAARFGTITVDALVGDAGTGPGSDGGGPGGGGAPPQSPPISDEPPVLARPATAVDVAGATVTWHVRDSWVRYASTEQEAVPLGGAVPGEAIPQAQHPCPDAPAAAAPPPLVYSYTLPFAHGWHDPVSGRTGLYTGGGARFVYPSHGIDLAVTNLEIELGAPGSRVIARFAGRGSTNPGNKRAVLANLAAGAPPATLKATIPSGGSESVFAGFYGAGDGFGCVTVSYSL